MSDFKTLLKETRDALTSLRQQTRSNNAFDKIAPPVSTFTLPQAIANIFNVIAADVERDIYVYDEKRHDTELQSPEKTTNNTSGDASHANTEAENASIEEAVEQSIKNASTSTADEISQYTQKFKSQAHVGSLFDYPESELENRENVGNLSACELNLYKLFSKESAFNSANIKHLKTSVSTVNSIKKATIAISYGRVSEAITILRNAKRDDVHNKSIAFCLSQLLYYRAHNGGSEYLPEAQTEARRACLSEDKSGEPHPKTLEYRYQTLTQEIQFHAEKSVETARDWYILSDDFMMGTKGLFVHDGYHLKTWILLSRLPLDNWEKKDIVSLSNIAMKTTAGALFYTRFFKEKISFVLNSPEPDPKFIPLLETEKFLSKAIHNHEAIQQNLALYTNEDRSLKDASKKPWLIENRYLDIFLKTSEIPSFAEIMLHCSLDGRKSDKEAYPTKSLHAAGLPTTQYWHAWALAVTPSGDMHSDVTLPIKRVASTLPILRKCDQLLLKLHEHEQSIIPEDKFKIIASLMPPYEYRVFIDIIAGSLAFKAPEDSYYMPLYRKWSAHPQGNRLPHIIMAEHAKKGGFVSAEEIITAFEGILRIISDRNHGLKARARKALKACSNHQSKKAKRSNNLLFISDHFSDYWVLYLLVLPFTLMTVIIISTASNYIEALLNTLILSLIFVACLSVVWIFNGASKGKKK